MRKKPFFDVLCFCAPSFLGIFRVKPKIRETRMKVRN